MKSPYRRTSRVVRFAELPTALRAALGAGTNASESPRDPIDADAAALHTRSIRVEAPGFLARLMGSADPDAEHETAVVVDGAALRVAMAGEKRGAKAWELPLDTLRVVEPPVLQGVDLGPSLTLESPAFGIVDHRVGTYTIHLGHEREAVEHVRALRERLAR